MGSGQGGRFSSWLILLGRLRPICCNEDRWLICCQLLVSHITSHCCLWRPCRGYHRAVWLVSRTPSREECRHWGRAKLEYRGGNLCDIFCPARDDLVLGTGVVPDAEESIAFESHGNVRPSCRQFIATTPSPSVHIP
ncbi:unnamed protein product [Discosporangium mesarthrocarpum]